MQKEAETLTKVLGSVDRVKAFTSRHVKLSHELMHDIPNKVTFIERDVRDRRN